MKLRFVPCLLSLGLLSLSFTASSGNPVGSEIQIVGRYARWVGDATVKTSSQPPAMNAAVEARIARAITVPLATPSPWLCKTVASGQFRCTYCDAVVYAWSAGYAYIGWAPIDLTQWAALNAADKHPLMASADWVLFADVDEFVNIHVGDHTISALLAALPVADAITLTWRLFGNAGVVAFQDRPVTEAFTRCAPKMLAWPWRAQMFKTLFRNNGQFRKLGVHRPRPGPGAKPNWFDGSGRALPPNTRLFSDGRADNYQLVQLNHYPLGAMESYLVKCDRGRANREASAFDMGYWIERNLCEAEDRSIAQIDSAPLRATLMADPVLAGLHADANAWRKARFAALMTDEPWRALFGRLLMTRPSRSLSAAEAALILIHGRAAKSP